MLEGEEALDNTERVCEVLLLLLLVLLVLRGANKWTRLKSIKVEVELEEEEKEVDEGLFFLVFLGLVAQGLA